MGSCWSNARPKVGTTPVLSKARVDGKAMYSYDNYQGVEAATSIYEAATDSGDSGAEVSENLMMPSLVRGSNFRVRDLAREESIHSSMDSFLSHPSLGLIDKQRTDSLKAECGSCIWRYITPSPRSFDENNFAELADDDMHVWNGQKKSTNVTKICKEDTETISEEKSIEDAEIFWIPDTLARHMGIWNRNSGNSRKATETIYANDEEIFMSVENNLSKYMESECVFAIRGTSFDNSVTDFSYNSNEEDVAGDEAVKENDDKNNNKEVQLSIPSLIFVDSNKNKGTGIKKTKDWISFDDKYNHVEDDVE
eukprot:TRINITY_DN32903_c0_g1_i1.p1 TRINITY_DN32903_c0_g1~~TRINITY_DN32903_c0_g1_i1.p1  ORF type:complete len:309 (-),score=86.78 TRINITY_DN32903_c0_g1_i1:251-1177(-)